MVYVRVMLVLGLVASWSSPRILTHLCPFNKRLFTFATSLMKCEENAPLYIIQFSKGMMYTVQVQVV